MFNFKFKFLIQFDSKSGLWDPDIWAQKISQNHASSNLLLKLSNGSIKRDRVLELNEKNGALKKRADLRDRLKEESQHDIILSPQRRSFDTGCHIAPNKNDNLRSSRNENHSHHQERRDLDYNVHRNENAGNGGRRLGMNRLIGQRDKGIDWGKSREYRDQEEMDIRRNNSRYSRFDYDSRRQMGNSRNNRCHRDAKHDHNRSLEEDEPEWYVGGPTSQNDTIELKGFEEDGSYHDSKNDHSSRSYSTDHSNRPNSRGPTSSKSDVYFNDHFCSKNGNLENLNAHYPNMFQNNSQDIDSNETNSKEKLKEDFDINEMFKLDNWRNMSSLSNENVSSIPINSEYSNESNSGTSRFAQWFSENKTDRQSPIDRLFANATFTSSNNSRRSSLHEDHLGSIVASADSSSSSLKIPFNRGNHAPIFEKKHQSNDGKVLLNILKKANINVNELIHQQPALPLIKLDQAKSVAELEAGLQNASSSNFKDSENDKNVLNKLLSRLEKSLATLKMNQDSNEKTMVQFSQNERNPPVNHSSHVLDILKEQSVKNRSNKILETLKSSLFDREKDQLLKNKLSHSKEEIFESSQSFESSSGGEAPIENQFSDSNAFFSNVDPIFSNCPINTGTVHNKVNKEDYIVEKKLNINDARNSISASSKIKSANISAFTPTSVIRKIASEKDKEAIRKVVSLDQALDGNQTDSLLTSQNRSNFDNELDEDAVKVCVNFFYFKSSFLKFLFLIISRVYGINILKLQKLK